MSVLQCFSKFGFILTSSFKSCAFWLATLFSSWLWRSIFVCKPSALFWKSALVSIIGFNLFFRLGCTICSGDLYLYKFMCGCGIQQFFKKRYYRYTERDVCLDLMYALTKKYPLGGLPVGTRSIVLRTHIQATMSTAEIILDKQWCNLLLELLPARSAHILNLHERALLSFWHQSLFPVLQLDPNAEVLPCVLCGVFLEWIWWYTSFGVRHSLSDFEWLRANWVPAGLSSVTQVGWCLQR